MKRIVKGVQSLNERAAQLTAAAGQLPSRVAELRAAMTATTGELQHLKSDIQMNVADLQVDREDGLSEALAEIAGHASALAEAGYVLDGLDVEISPVQRLIVQLVRYRAVSPGALQGLIDLHQERKSLRAILSAILKARAMVDSIEIDGLDYHKLTIGIGPVPTIRLCWRETKTEAGDLHPLDSKRQTPLEFSGVQTSFFGPTPAFAPMAGLSPAPAAEDAGGAPVEIPPPPHSAPATARPTPPPLPVDPLAKFKVMPRL
jgi:hypothetical protein